jgi:uncharacterized protein (DUF433 family)
MACKIEKKQVTRVPSFLDGAAVINGVLVTKQAVAEYLQDRRPDCHN